VREKVHRDIAEPICLTIEFLPPDISIGLMPVE
jgi:hypothetical protein